MMQVVAETMTDTLKAKNICIQNVRYTPYSLFSPTAQPDLLKLVRSCHLSAECSEIATLLRIKSKVWIWAPHKVLHGAVLADSALSAYLLPLIVSLLVLKQTRWAPVLHLSLSANIEHFNQCPKWPVPMTQCLPGLLLPHFSLMFKLLLIRVLIYPPISHLHPLLWPLSDYLDLLIYFYST